MIHIKEIPCATVCLAIFFHARSSLAIAAAPSQMAESGLWHYSVAALVGAAFSAAVLILFEEIYKVLKSWFSGLVREKAVENPTTPAVFRGHMAGGAPVFVSTTTPESGVFSIMTIGDEGFIMRWTEYAGGFGTAQLVCYSIAHFRGIARLVRPDHANKVFLHLTLFGHRLKIIELKMVR